MDPAFLHTFTYNLKVILPVCVTTITPRVYFNAFYSLKACNTIVSADGQSKPLRWRFTAC